MEYKINEVYFDYRAKDYVKLTNKICLACAAGQKHDGECDMVPYEAVALRVFGLSKAGKYRLGWTYIDVQGHDLRDVGDRDRALVHKFFETYRGGSVHQRVPRI
jgi:hypothetical protein